MNIKSLPIDLVLQLSERLRVLAKNYVSEHAHTNSVEMDQNPWLKLLNLWENERVTNCCVQDSIKLNVIPYEIQAMDYSETLVRGSSIL